MIHVTVSPDPVPTPIDNPKAVLWDYNAVYIRGKKVIYPLVENKDIINIAGTNGITRSGRVFSPPLKDTIEETPSRDKGKRVVSEAPKPTFN